MPRDTWKTLLGRGASVHLSRAEAEPLLRRALDLASREGASEVDRANLLHHLGDACRALGKLEEAESLLTESVEIGRRLTPDTAWATESALGLVKRLRGDFAGAIAIYERLASERDSRSGGVWTAALADAHLAAGHLSEVEPLYERARELLERGSSDPTMRAEQLLRMGLALEKTGNLQRALEVVREAESLMEEVVRGKTMSISARLPGAVLDPIRQHRERLEAARATSGPDGPPVAAALGAK